MIDEGGITYRWETVGHHFDERGRRLFRGGGEEDRGLAVVSQITGLARSRINRGDNDMDAGPLGKAGRGAVAGADARAVSERDPGLVPAERCRARGAGHAGQP
jgi:hypothetical protein